LRGRFKEPATTDQITETHITMAPTIYVAKHLPSGSTPTPLFNLKGMDNLAPAQMSTILLEGVPLEKQVAYTEYSNNIACFLFATSHNKTITVTGLPIGPLLQHLTSFPIPCPTVSFTLKKPLDSDRSRKLLGVLGPGSSTTVSGKTTIYNAPVLPSDKIDMVMSLVPPHFNTGRDAVNPSGAKAYMILAGIMETFLRTHSYPAFSAEDEDSITEFHTLAANGSAYRLQMKKDDAGNEVQQFDPKDFSWFLQNDGGDAMDEDDGDDDDDNVASKLRAAHGKFSTDGVDTVFKAKPCPLPQTNIGSRKDVPHLPGIVFPYFHGLTQPDGVYIAKTILRLFFPILGSTVQQCQETFVTLRRGCNSLSTTDEGLAMTHLLKGVDLALSTQTRCFMLYDSGKYHGFVLLGAKFAIFDNTIWVNAGSPEDLRSALSSMDPHDAAVKVLIEKFGVLTEKAAYSGPAVTEATFAEPENLVEVFKGLTLSSVDQAIERDIDRALRNLNYMGQGYLARNPQVVAEVLESLSTGAHLRLTRPTYIPSIRIDIGGKVFAALSKFGPEAVSFWNDRGIEIRCEAKDKVNVNLRKRKVGEMDLYGNMPDKILISAKPLSVAVRDLETVMKKGVIKIDMSERAGRYRNMSVESEDMRKRIWKALVSVVEETSQAKRPRVETPDNGGEIDFDALFNQLVGQ